MLDGLSGYEFRPLCDVAALAPEALVDVKAATWCRREGVKDEVCGDPMAGLLLTPPAVVGELRPH